MISPLTHHSDTEMSTSSPRRKLHSAPCSALKAHFSSCWNWIALWTVLTGDWALMEGIVGLPEGQFGAPFAHYLCCYHIMRHLAVLCQMELLRIGLQNLCNWEPTVGWLSSTQLWTLCFGSIKQTRYCPCKTQHKFKLALLSSNPFPRGCFYSLVLDYLCLPSSSEEPNVVKSSILSMHT